MAFIQIINTVSSVAYMLLRINELAKVGRALVGQTEEEPHVNHKVEAILNSHGIIKNPVDASEEQYIRVIEDGLNKAKLDPQLTVLATDLMRISPSARQYRVLQDGLKKELHLSDVTSDPWVHLESQLFFNRSGEVERVRSLVIYIQKGRVEPGYRVHYGDQGSVRSTSCLYFFGSSRQRFISKTIPSLRVELPNGDSCVLENVFKQVAHRRDYQNGKRVAIRIAVSRSKYQPASETNTIKEYVY